MQPIRRTRLCSANLSIRGRDRGGVVNPAIEEHRLALADLCRRYGVVRLSLFGSATSAAFDPERSDLDFVVDFEDFPPGRYADAYFGLLESLEALLGRPVDLIVGSAIHNPYFKESVDQTKALVYAA